MIVLLVVLVAGCGPAPSDRFLGLWHGSVNSPPTTCPDGSVFPAVTTGIEINVERIDDDHVQWQSSCGTIGLRILGNKGDSGGAIYTCPAQTKNGTTVVTKYLNVQIQLDAIGLYFAYDLALHATTATQASDCFPSASGELTRQF